MEQSIQRGEIVESLKDALRQSQESFAKGISWLLRDLLSTIIFMVGAGYISTRIGTIPMILLIMFQAGYVLSVVTRSVELIKTMRMSQKLWKITKTAIKVIQESELEQQLVVNEE